MAQTNPDRSLATQTSILKAATALTKKNGWANTTIRGICTEAGVSIGAFYHHFASKQELMNQAFLLFDETLDENLPQSGMTPLRAIKDVLLTQTAFIVDEAGPLIAEYYKNILSDEKKSAASPQREYYRRVLMHVRQAKDAHLFAAVYTPEYITELLIKYVRGSIIDWCLHDYSYDVVKRTEEELDILIGALTVSQR
jgi:AcrR family transcriptional regulator